jgi:hypothetical protein
VAATRIRLSIMDYNEAPDAFLILFMNAKTLDIQKPNPHWLSWCKLVPQLPRVVTFAYELRFRCVIACWKGLSENYTFCSQTLTLSTI